jgi:hypothetical protein
MELAILSDIEPGEVETEALDLSLNGEEDFFCYMIGAYIEEALSEQAEVGLEVGSRRICEEGVYVVTCEGIIQF